MIRWYDSVRRKENGIMLDWTHYLQELGQTLPELAKLTPDTLRGYNTLSDANAKTGQRGAKTRELISLAVAVTTSCYRWMAVHAEAAVKHGATREESAEALVVAVAIKAGAPLVYA